MLRVLLLNRAVTAPSAKRAHVRDAVLSANRAVLREARFAPILPVDNGRVIQISLFEAALAASKVFVVGVVGVVHIHSLALNRYRVKRPARKKSKSFKIQPLALIFGVRRSDLGRSSTVICQFSVTQPPARPSLVAEDALGARQLGRRGKGRACGHRGFRGFCPASWHRTVEVEAGQEKPVPAPAPPS